MSQDRDPAVRGATRGVGVGGLALVCVALVTAAVVVGYVFLTEFVHGR